MWPQGPAVFASTDPCYQPASATRPSAELIPTPSRRPPPAHTDDSLSRRQSPLDPEHSGLRHAHLRSRVPTDAPINRKGGDGARITARPALIISLFNEAEVEAGRPGGTATPNKSDYLGADCFSFRLAIPLILSLWNNFPALLQEAETFVFGVHILFFTLLQFLYSILWFEEEVPETEQYIISHGWD